MKTVLFVADEEGISVTSESSVNFRAAGNGASYIHPNETLDANLKESVLLTENTINEYNIFYGRWSASRLIFIDQTEFDL